MENSITKQAINKRVKELLKEDANKIYKRIKSQYNYRYGGIEFISFNQLLREIAEADLKGVDFV